MHSDPSFVTDPPDLRSLYSERSWPSAALPPSSILEGQTVLVSGAGGSLGRRLVHTLCRFPVRRVLALDASEHMLVRLREQVAGQLSEGDGVPPPVQFVLGDLRVPSNRRRALAHDPDVVLHASAYKHVPFLENRPIAAVENNLLTTVDWVRECREAGVGSFLFISTDKAVTPTSVMGRTKRWAEQWLRRRDAEATQTCVSTVRLCNLFGSRGSVVPRFLRCLRQGESLPVTDPDMHRWFMTPSDASRAVLWSLAVSSGTYVPTSCLYVSIPSLARRLIRWRYPDADPEGWIRWVGSRAGERLHEQLWGPDEEAGPAHVSALRRVEGPLVSSSLSLRIEALRAACAEGRAGAVRRLLSPDEDVPSLSVDDPPTSAAQVGEGKPEDQSG